MPQSPSLPRSPRLRPAASAAPAREQVAEKGTPKRLAPRSSPSALGW